ncbi:MAG: aminopeptidase P family protein [Anaerolineae bacterium]|nr:aminopeptidase P family protein [Anaerolineae bacterium]
MSRLEQFRQQMAQEDIDGFLITQPENRRYLSGFTGSNGVLIITAEQQVLATDSRYYEQVREQCPDWELVEVGYDFVGNMLELLRRLGLGARRVGFEAEHVSVATLHAWERALLGRLILIHAEGFVEQLRMRKDKTEIASIKKAVALADDAFAHISAWLRPGQTELQVAWELESYMRTHGAEAVSFKSIVAGGPNSAKPHAVPTERSLQPGEPIVLDFGCMVGGYCSDMTRTVCLGQPADGRYLEVWNIVREAQETALSGAKAGMTGVEVDKLARQVIDQAGYKDNFGHALGHSLGLAIHENPRFSFNYPHQIPAGAVMSVEPGIYLPGWGGVRHEDLVVVREEGLEILSKSPKEAVLKVT